jgi:hypothetical protein
MSCAMSRSARVDRERASHVKRQGDGRHRTSLRSYMGVDGLEFIAQG